MLKSSRLSVLHCLRRLSIRLTIGLSNKIRPRSCATHTLLLGIRVSVISNSDRISLTLSFFFFNPPRDPPIAVYVASRVYRSRAAHVRLETRGKRSVIDLAKIAAKRGPQSEDHEENLPVQKILVRDRQVRASCAWQSAKLDRASAASRNREDGGAGGGGGGGNGDDRRERKENEEKEEARGEEEGDGGKEGASV